MTDGPATTPGTPMTPYEAAKAWSDAGCSVVPPMQDGTKRPLGEWKHYMQQHPSLHQLEEWYRFGGRTGIGLVCGKVSGNLEMLELEGRATNSDSLDKIWEACVAFDVTELWTALCDGYVERTPSGGIHFLYRIMDEDASVPGNTKIARRPATPEELAENPQDRVKTLAETRGEGGYVVVAPSHGAVHPSGESWDMISGQPGQVKQVLWTERCKLHEAIHVALDEMPEPDAPPEQPRRPMLPGERRPGDEFNERTTWSDILLPLGWTFVYKKGDKRYWRRPGKNLGVSATTSDITDRLWVFSSSTEFEPEKHYSRFEAFTLLEHHGDFKAAAGALARQGLGSRRDPFASGVLAPPVQATVSKPQGDMSVPVQKGAEAAVAAESPTSLVECDDAGIPVYPPTVFKHMKRWDGITLADAWVGLNKGVFRYVGSDKAWMHFDGKMWNRAEKGRERLAAQYMVAQMNEHIDSIDDEDVKKSLKREVKRYSGANGISSILTNANCRREIAAEWEDFDKTRHLVTVDNGILDLNTFELLPHDHSKMLSRKISATYDPSKAQGRFTRFMEEVLPDPQVRAYLQRVCGYALTGQADERVLVQLYGPSGTGKSQFTKALFTVMGDFAKRASESAFQSRPTSYKGPSEDLHSLMGSRFAMLPELDEGFRLNVSLIKALTGGDPLTTRRLYGQEVSWRPEYTIFMITNHLPRVSAGEEAYWNRVKPIKFDQVFVDRNGEALNNQDRNLGEKMATEEPEVILNWLLEGLRQYRLHGLEAPPQVAQWRDDYRDEVDTVRQFLNEAPDEGRIEVVDQATVTVRQLHKTYAAWCSDNGIPALGMRKFGERMEANGFKKGKREQGIMWSGIKIVGFIGEAQLPIQRNRSWSPLRT